MIVPRKRASSSFPAWAVFRPIAWIVMAIGALTTYADPDLWGHLRFGLDILRDRQLTETDVYSFTQDIPWVNHEWLSETIMGVAYDRGGATGLIILKVLLVLGSYGLLWSALRGGPKELRWGAVALGAVATLPITYTIRPQLWSLLLLLATCRLLTAPRQYLWWIPLLFVPWVNLHGGWIVGIGLLVGWCVCRALERDQARPPIWILAAVVLFSLLATLANPYGVDLWTFIAETVRLSRTDIQEWQPLWRAPGSSWKFWVAGLVFIGYVLRRFGRCSISTAAPIAMLAGASLLVDRLVPLFVPVTVTLLAPMLGRERERPVTVPLQRTLFDLAVAVLVSMLMLQSTTGGGCIRIDGYWVPDMRAAAALRASDARGRLITWFDWGEYAIWHLSPTLKVSFDGRRETLYSPATIIEQLAIGTGEPAGFAALERLSPEYVWLSNIHATRTKDWLRDNGYRIDVDTARSFVAVRQNLPLVRLLDSRPDNCFP